MTVKGIEKLCVVGAGKMGHQIAVCAALGGYSVTCTDTVPEMLREAEEFADTWLDSRVAKGKIAEAVANEARANLTFTSSLEKAASDADMVIEAIFEKLDLKRELFATLDSMCPTRAILATNSSYIVGSQIADATRRPDRVINMHFFNPALVMKLVEVVKGPEVSDETADTVMAVSRSLGKVPVLLAKEIYGFLINRLLDALNQEALYLHDMGVATYEDIDLAVVNALGHPMGPFRLMDLTGIDLSYLVRMELYRKTGDTRDKPSPTIVEKYTRGEWGERVGKGFYEYSKEK